MSGMLRGRHGVATHQEEVRQMLSNSPNRRLSTPWKRAIKRCGITSRLIKPPVASTPLPRAIRPSVGRMARVMRSVAKCRSISLPNQNLRPPFARCSRCEPLLWLLPSPHRKTVPSLLRLANWKPRREPSCTASKPPPQMRPSQPQRVAKVSRTVDPQSRMTHPRVKLRASSQRVRPCPGEAMSSPIVTNWPGSHRVSLSSVVMRETSQYLI